VVVKRVVITTPIRQAEWCLPRYLDSIYNLDYPKEDLSLYWLVGDTTDNTYNILREFKKKHEKKYRGITIEEMSFGTSYSPHRWGHYSGNYPIELYPPEQHQARQRIANMIVLKNRCLQQVLDGNDYVLVIDVDILLQPPTLKHLVEVAEEKHIGVLGEILWFRWYKWLPPAPNVWEEAEYNLSDRFLKEITKPNIVMCGGMCPPYLVSREAVEAGVNYNVIYNVPWWGEDRFLSVRAVALGFKLFVDTNFPAIHLDSNEFVVEDYRWATYPERDSEEYRAVVKEIESLGTVYPHWSRDWEYPYAYFNSELREDMTVLDAGCGNSPFKLFLLRHCGSVHCIDKEPIDTPENITFKQCDMSEIPYPDGYFDRVFCISVLEHIVEGDGRVMPMKYIDELLRVTKRGGKLILTIDVNRYPTQWRLWLPEFWSLCRDLGVEPPAMPWNTLRSEAHHEGKLVGEGLSVAGFVLRKGDK
jgi:SAM-dependent methyltransferase/GT2 family glycosyltransferase